ncbi:MAG: tetratricopeptide repeat protein [Planctomycetes bacterium]|nr:tetratricopeptide repeat protein [Planctomycetota bacterium]
MSWLQRVKIWRELKRLEAKARENPSPSTFVDLGQVHINLGDIDRSLQVAEEGLVLFPRSEELRKLRKFARKHQINERIQELRSKINRSASAKLYRELAALYLELGDFGAVHGTCEEGLRRFPEDAELHLVHGRARLTGFYKDLDAKQGLDAVHCLQRVLELKPGEVKAHKLLAEVLFRVGATNVAVQHLEVLRESTPEDAEVETLYQEAIKRPSEDEELDELFAKVETSGRLAVVPVTPVRQDVRVAEDDLAPVRRMLAQVAELGGVRKAVYIRGPRALVKGDIRDGKDAFLRVVRVFAKSSQRVARRMELGSFSKGAMEGEFGRICVCSYGEEIAAVLCDPGTLTDRVLADLQDLVALGLHSHIGGRP